MLDLRHASVKRPPEHGGRVIGLQLQPRPEPGGIVIRRFLDEFDAQMAAARKVHEQHWLWHGWVANIAYWPAAQRHFKTPLQRFAPVRTSEHVRIGAEPDHSSMLHPPGG